MAAKSETWPLDATDEVTVGAVGPELVEGAEEGAEETILNLSVLRSEPSSKCI